MESATAIPARFLSILDFDHETLSACLERAAEYKAARAAGVADEPVLLRRHVALLFEKPSLRTRVSFQAAVAQLGGTALFLPAQEVGLGWRESLPDFARTMSHYVDASLPQQFDAYLWFDESTAVTPLGREHATAGLPDTYPFGL